MSEEKSGSDQSKHLEVELIRAEAYNKYTLLSNQSTIERLREESDSDLNGELQAIHAKIMLELGGMEVCKEAFEKVFGKCTK